MYKEYHACWYKMILAKRECEKTQLIIDGILLELTKTVSQLRDITTDGSHLSDKMCSLTSAKVDGEEVLNYQKNLYEYRKSIVDQKQEELKKSKEVDDIIYCLKFISKFKTREIARVISYTREYTYELITKIKEKIKQIEEEINEEFEKK